jgi:hypothetical protein
MPGSGERRVQMSLTSPTGPATKVVQPAAPPRLPPRPPHPPSGRRPFPPVPLVLVDLAIAGAILFEYLGPSAILVVGPVTGRPYHFAPGVPIAVDPLDAPSFDAVLQFSRVS